MYFTECTLSCRNVKGPLPNSTLEALTCLKYAAFLIGTKQPRDGVGHVLALQCTPVISHLASKDFCRPLLE